MLGFRNMQEKLEKLYYSEVALDIFLIDFLSVKHKIFCKITEGKNCLVSSKDHVNLQP